MKESEPKDFAARATTPADDKSLPGPKRSGKRVVILVGLVLAVLAGAGFVFSNRSIMQAPSSNQAANNPAARDYAFAPRFTQVNAYIKYKDAEWYAVPGAVIKVQAGHQPKYYRHSEGLPLGILTGLTTYKDALWLSSQAGTAVLKADGSAFTEVPVDGKTSIASKPISNGKLYHDELSGKLYLSTFESFYQYNDATKAWEAMAGTRPVNAQGFVANKSFAVANANALGAPTWLYSKKNASWKLSTVAGMEEQVASVFAMGDDIFIMGRPVGYTSCEQAGKMTATVAYHLDQTGTWQPMTGFNGDKARPELSLGRHVKDPTTTVYTRGCGAGEKKKVYTLQYRNGDLSLTNEKAANDSVGIMMGDDGEQQVVVDELAKATGLYPFTRALALDKAGNLIFGFSTKYDASSVTTETGIAVAKGTDLTDAKPLEIPGLQGGRVARPIMCDGALAYVFVGVPGAGEGGPTQRWESAKLLSVKGSKTSEFAELGTDAARPVFACSGQKISWLGKEGIKQLDTKTKAIAAVGPKLGSDISMLSGQTYALANGDMWVMVTPDPSAGSGTLYYFETAKSMVTKVAALPNAPTIRTASPTHAWLSTATAGSPNVSLAMLDKKGTKIYAKPYTLPVSATATTDSTVSMLSGDKGTEFFPLVKFNQLDAQGNESLIEANKVAMHSFLYSMQDPADSNFGLFDKGRMRVWITDPYLGLFSVPVQ